MVHDARLVSQLLDGGLQPNGVVGVPPYMAFRPRRTNPNREFELQRCGELVEGGWLVDLGVIALLHHLSVDEWLSASDPVVSTHIVIPTTHERGVARRVLMGHSQDVVPVDHAPQLGLELERVLDTRPRHRVDA